ncbi:MAG: Asp-tRNA(Asn)/Glu-tRNA(Gln) amidotransferase subunit GatA [Pseudomonadota bacterium]
MNQDLREASVTELRALLDAKSVSSVELTKLFLDEIGRRNPELNAFITVTPDPALHQAEEADRRIASRRDVRPLTGIPVAVKDTILVKGVRATAASQILKSFIAPYDATVTRRILDAGAVILGKTNCDEFAMGSSTENSSFGNTHNPWNLKCVPGGSSGGSAAALAARLAPLALGTDTGGSVRQPAAMCGISALKPTYGRVSRFGVIAFASSLDQVGPMARTTKDVAALYETIAGADPNDSTCSASPVGDLKSCFTRDLKGLRIGYPKEYVPKEMAKEVRENFFAALKALEKLGANVEEVSLPHTEYAIACYYIVATAEASSNLARYDGVRYTSRAAGAKTLRDLYVRSRTEAFGAEVQRRILLGTFVLSSGYYDAYYRKAQQVRTLIRADFEKAFSKVDVIATPTSPTPAFELGSKVTSPLEMYLSDIFTVSISLAGLPGLAVPSGFVAAGLPLGLQLVGKPSDEVTLFRTGHAYEDETRYFTKRPPA